MPELDLGNYLADDALVLTNIASRKHPKGASYSVPSLDAKDGLALRHLMRLSGSDPLASLDDPAVDKAFEAFCGKDAKGELIPFDQKILGTAYKQMLADGVSSDRLSKIVSVVWLSFAQGEEIARAMVAGPGEAEARPNRATRRAATRSTSRNTGGSKSSRASTPTPARTRQQPATTRGTGRSSTSRNAPAKAS